MKSFNDYLEMNGNTDVNDKPWEQSEKIYIKVYEQAIKSFFERMGLKTSDIVRDDYNKNELKIKFESLDYDGEANQQQIQRVQNLFDHEDIDYIHFNQGYTFVVVGFEGDVEIY